ncbi:unnamed protein product [Angiostrongylus costaricensis]|uniref:Cadherin domain protein n=1 Tax=Angiostrongylus costaricensis TaxID=334426 RepID=A0A158PE76_ANGCS|nr:unnamed protein product [Angiostrongylus costaricensis]
MEVQLQNSYSNAHFRREKYSRSITVDKVHPGNQLLQVELEGVPIDEASFVILHGNPGWLSIEDYGGRIWIDSYIRQYKIKCINVNEAALEVQLSKKKLQRGGGRQLPGGDRGRRSAERRAAGPDAARDHGGRGIHVREQAFLPKLLRTSARSRISLAESSSEFFVPFKLRRNAVVNIESAFAIDEDGQQRDFQEGDLTISKEAVVFRKRSLVDLRVISVQLVSERETATVFLTLTSSPEFIESRRKELARPLFPLPWTREDSVIELSISEELPPGHIIYTLPAVNPMDGSLVSLVMDGDMKEMFAVDSTTGAISVVQRLDFESLSPSDRTFSLRLSAGLLGYEAEAELGISIINIDDNAPTLEKEGMLEVAIPENLSPSTTIAHLRVTDRDALGSVDDFSVLKSGIGSELFSAYILNGSLMVAVAENATLDREVMERQTVHLTVRDTAGNQDSVTLHVLLLDVNDNTPKFSQNQYAIQVVDNWPVDTVVDRLTAYDSDDGRNSYVTYSLAAGSIK